MSLCLRKEKDLIPVYLGLVLLDALTLSLEVGKLHLVVLLDTDLLLLEGCAEGGCVLGVLAAH